MAREHLSQRQRRARLIDKHTTEVIVAIGVVRDDAFSHVGLGMSFERATRVLAEADRSVHSRHGLEILSQ